MGVLGTQEHGKPRLGLLLLLAGEMGDDATDDGGALVALPGPAAVVQEQTVEPALVLGLGQQRPDPLQECRLQVGGDVVLGPRLDRQHLGACLVLVGKVGGGERAHAGGGPGLLVGEERLDLLGARLARQQRLLGTLIEEVAVGPIGIAVEEGAHLRGRSIAAAVEVPVDELASGRIGDLLADGHGLRHPSAGNRADRLAQAACVLGRDGLISHLGDGRVVARHMIGFLRRPARHGVGGRSTPACYRRQAERPTRWPSRRSWASRVRQLWPGRFGGSRLSGGRLGFGLGGGLLAGHRRTGDHARHQESGQRLRNGSHHVQFWRLAGVSNCPGAGDGEPHWGPKAAST